MKKSIAVVAMLVFVVVSTASAQREGRKNSRAVDIPDSPLPIGAPGIAWYTTWDTGVEEAKRSNRPIFFMSAATTCSGISGVF